MSFPNRNAPCPCGSGKKYKQCCLKRDEAITSSRRTETASIPKLIQAAMEHHQAGRLPEAEAIYQQVLQAMPDNPDALHLLGLIAHQVGKNEIAAELIGKAINVSPSSPMYNNLGLVLQAQGELDRASVSYRKALALDPCYAVAHFNLGNLLQAQSDLDSAVVSYHKALALKQDYAEAYCNLGNTLHAQGKFDSAVVSYHKALALKPGDAEVYNNLGTALKEQGKLDAAIENYRHALLLKPDYAEAHNNLGAALQKQDKLDEAVACYLRVVSINPDYAEAHSNLGNILNNLGRLEEAEASCRRALQIKPDYAEALLNLGTTLCSLDDLGQASAAYQKTLEVDPANKGLHAAVHLAVLHYLDSNFEQCRSKLLASQMILAKAGFEQKNFRIYWLYLDKLLSWHQQSNQKANQTRDMKTLYVVGESHALSAHRVVVRYNEQEMRCAAEWISGCKQWHLGSGKTNKYKHKFEAIMARLSRDSAILLLIGEIDCRYDEGIIKVWKKYPDKELADVMQSTVSAYINYVAAIGDRYGHRIIIGGVPATNFPLDVLAPPLAGQVVHLIRIFNAALKSRALASGMDFLDVYALTDRGDGVASGKWHIDDIHLQPSAVVEAFGKYCLHQ